MIADTSTTIMIPDPFDADLHELFAGVQPAAGFEDRLIHAVRRRDRFAIPFAVKRAAIAAAAVLVVGAAGYYGNLAITGNLRFASVNASPIKAASNLHQIGQAILVYQTDSDHWDFGGGSNSAQNWKDWNAAGGVTRNFGYSYQHAFADSTAIANGWQQKSPDAASGISADMRPATPALTGPVAVGTPVRRSKSAPYDNLDSVLLPYAHGNGEQQQKAAADTFGTAMKSKSDLAVSRSKLDTAAPELVDRFNNDSQSLAASDVKTRSVPPVAYTPNPVVTLNNPDGDLTKVGEGRQGPSQKSAGEDYYFGGHVQAGIYGVAPKEPAAAINTAYFKNPSFKVQDASMKPTGQTVSANGQAPKAFEESNQRSTGFSREKESELTDLVRDARQFTEESNYAKALDAVTNIQKIDPNNAYAGGVKGVLVERARNQEARQRQAEFSQNFNLNPLPGANDSKEKAVAYNDQADIAAANQAVAQPLAAPDAQNKPPVQAPLPAAQPPVAAPAPAVDDRKIIRTGSMEFDVDRFDTAQMQITKIVGELGGFVGATDSTKLPNGKVRGSISVRVPPERLDTLVLSLRALGDLKSQQITAADITKEYTDIQSELAADRAMQDRLLQLIHDGKGSVKDLLAAENELGEWRTKIEKAEGMIRYYNGQVALSTLSITMIERDIHTPATAVETETADVGIEADDVEKARTNAMKAIDDAKGRIVEAELKRFDAGQLAAKLVADVPPESAGAVIDQLKLLGKVARLEVHRQQQNTDGTAAVTNNTPLRTERKPTRLLISIYNLANVAPRRTTVVNLAAKDVEGAYAALLTAVKSDGGRVVTSNLDRGDPVKATGSLVLEVLPEKFDSALATLHAQGDVLNLNLTENPDTQNSTEAKQGLTVKLISLANVAPRRTTNTSLAANDVDTAYAALIAATKSNGGRVVSSTLDRGESGKTSGSLILEIPPDQLEATLATLHAQGDVLNLNQSENADTQNSTEAKQGLTVKLFSQAAVKARESIDQTLAATDVPASYQAILSAASSAHARIEQAALNEQDRQNITGDIELEVPRTSISELDKAIASAGGTLARTSSRAPDTDTAVDSKLHLKLTISSADRLPPRETTRLQVEVSDVDKSAGSIQAATLAVGGRVLEASVRKDNGQSIGRVILDFPLNQSMELLQQVRSQGTVRNIDSSRDPQAPAGPMAHAQIFIEFRTGDAIVADQSGPWASIREGLSTSINGLLWSLRWVVVGLCLIGPWALIGWGAWKVRGRFVRSRAVTEAKV